MVTMYIICTYDVEDKRCIKVMKILRKYMFHIQNSVFEGELTPLQFSALELELKGVIHPEYDQIKFYFTYNNKHMQQKELGKIKNTTCTIIT